MLIQRDSFFPLSEPFLKTARSRTEATRACIGTGGARAICSEPMRFEWRNALWHDSSDLFGCSGARNEHYFNRLNQTEAIVLEGLT